MLRNPLNPAGDPTLHRPADKPGNTTGENNRGDLDEIGEDENIAEQALLKLLEMPQYDLPKRDRVYEFPPGMVRPSPNHRNA